MNDTRNARRSGPLPGSSSTEIRVGRLGHGHGPSAGAGAGVPGRPYSKRNKPQIERLSFVLIGSSASTFQDVNTRATCGGSHILAPLDHDQRPGSGRGGLIVATTCRRRSRSLRRRAAASGRRGSRVRAGGAISADFRVERGVRAPRPRARARGPMRDEGPARAAPHRHRRQSRACACPVGYR